MMSEAFAVSRVFDQAHLDLRIRLLQGLGGRFHIEGPEDGGSLVDIEFLDDVRQIRRMELGQAVLGDRQPQQIRRGEGLDEFPGDQLIRHVVVEKDLEEEIRSAFSDRPPHETVETDIHMDQVEDLLRLEKLQIVDPPDLCPVRIDHLLVQEGFLQQEFSPGRSTGSRKSSGWRGWATSMPLTSNRRSPGEQDTSFRPPRTQENIRDRRIGLADVPGQVEDLADGTAFGINDFSPRSSLKNKKT